MNEQHLAQLIRNIKTIRQSLAYLLNDLQDLTLEDPAVNLPDDDPKLKRFTVFAKKKLMRADGDWVLWTDLRPAYRDRAEYNEPLWNALTGDPDLETRTTLPPRGSGVRREARYNPLI